MKRKLYYEFIIQEKVGDFWSDKYIDTDRKYVSDLLNIFRKKYPYIKFRVVRSVQWQNSLSVTSLVASYVLILSYPLYKGV